MISSSQAIQSSEHYLKLGMSYLEKGKNDIAEDILNKAVSISKTPSETHFNIGIIYLQKKQFDLSLESLKKSCEIDPNNTKAKEYIHKVIMLKNNL